MTVRVFVFSRSAVLVEPRWLPAQPGYAAERGARVEVRLLGDEPPRGSGEAAQRVVIDTPVWRADLFDLVDGEPANLAAAHFHPTFGGDVEAGDRVFDDELRRNPMGWLRDQLGDLVNLAVRAGIASLATPPTWLEADAADVRCVLPDIEQAVSAALAEARARLP